MLYGQTVTIGRSYIGLAIEDLVALCFRFSSRRLIDSR